MPERWKLSFTALAALGMVAMAQPATAGVPNSSQSFFVPQRGTLASPIEGTTAITFFRACPNNDGGTSLPGNARIKVVVRDSNGNGIPGISAADICLLFNGGTAAQGFSGVGADSVIANGQFNQTPLCPDVRCVQADAETDAAGTTFITFTGSAAGAPGIGVRNPTRKWGHYDTNIPVYVLGFQIPGRLRSPPEAVVSYSLQIKNYDWTGGLGTGLNQGEVVSSADFNGVATQIGLFPLNWYWRDFDNSGGIASGDFNQISTHTTHNCSLPNNP